MLVSVVFGRMYSRFPPFFLSKITVVLFSIVLCITNFLKVDIVVTAPDFLKKASRSKEQQMITKLFFQFLVIKTVVINSIIFVYEYLLKLLDNVRSVKIRANNK